MLPLCLCLLAGPAEPGADAYAAGTACFEQLDYHCAIELLGAARSQTGVDGERMIEIYRKLAESHLALGQRREAVAAFSRLLDLEPGYRIEKEGTSPKILDAFSEAQKLREQEEPARMEIRAPPPKEPMMQIGFSAGAQLLFGRDRDLLHTGAAFGLEADFFLDGPWRALIGLRYSFHDLRQDDSSVHLVGAWGGFGAAMDLGPVQAGIAGGVGLARFGIMDREGKTALLIPLRLSASLPLGGLCLGLFAEPGWMITIQSGAATSFAVVAGARVALGL